MSVGAGAGALDRKVQFMRATPQDDGFTVRDVWAALDAPVWASRTDISDGERWRAAEVQAAVTTRFVVRSSAFSRGITPKDRLVCQSVTYDISGIKEIGRLNRLEITAAARVDL